MKTFSMVLRQAGRTAVLVRWSDDITGRLRHVLRAPAHIVTRTTAWLADRAAGSRPAVRDARGAHRRGFAGPGVALLKGHPRGTAGTRSRGAVGVPAAITDHDAAAQMRGRTAVSGDAAIRQGSIALVGAGPGAWDLLTLRALRHLQQADAVFYDRLVDPGVLDLVRPDADLVFVGKEVGRHSWPQSRIDAVIVEAALQGKRVVRLKSGDPAIFGRATEEFAAARAAGIAVEMIPGVTAASAAAASLGRALTERGRTEALVLVTGTCRAGDDDPDWGALARPGTTLALYMAVGKLVRIRDALLRAGVPGDSDVEVVMAASTGHERVLRTCLARLGASGRQVVAPALVLVRHGKDRIGTPPVPAGRCVESEVAG